MSPPQRAVQEFAEGEPVHLKLDPSVPGGRYHPRFDGHTGTVVGQQGEAYKVAITDGGVEKTLIVKPAHLRPQE
jgi:large subunit ribosomal protein L21e